MNGVTIDQAASFLNDLLRIDPVAIQILLEAETAVGPELADHPTIQVMPQPSFDQSTGLYMLRFLGLLNGLFGVLDSTRVIAAIYDDKTWELLRFEVRALVDGQVTT